MSFHDLNIAAGVIIAAVVNSMALAVFIVSGAWALFKFLPGVNAATRHAIWWAIFVAVLTLPFVPYALDLEVAVPTRAVYEGAAPLSGAPAPQMMTADDVEIVSPPVAKPKESIQVSGGYAPLLLAVLSLVILVLQTVRVISSYVYLRRIKRSSVPANRELHIAFNEWLLGCRVGRECRLLISDKLDSPVAIGFREPAVVVPRQMEQRLSPDDLDHVLLHELAHLARRDDWTNLFARVAAGVFALHPVAVWILRRIDAERETACDDWVVTMTGASRPYAASLARLAEFRLARRREMLATGIAGRQSQFRSRIERLLRSSEWADARTSAVKVAMSIVALLVLLYVATWTPQWLAFAQDNPPVAIIPHAPANPVAPVAIPTPPRAAVSVPDTISAPPAPPAARPFTVAAIPPAPIPPPAPQTSAVRESRSESGSESLLAALANAGYSNLDVDEIIKLGTHGISARYLTAMNNAGWGKLTPDQLIQLSTHGVTPRFLQGIADSGLKNLTLNDTIEMSIHGVRPELIREIHALGFGPYTSKQLIEFSIHGARPDLFRALKDSGFQSADPKQILEAVTHGVKPSDIREAQQYGLNLTLRQIIRLKQAGMI